MKAPKFIREWLAERWFVDALIQHTIEHPCENALACRMGLIINARALYHLPNTWTPKQ